MKTTILCSLFLLLLSSLVPAVANAQTEDLPRWEIAAGGTAIHVSKLNGTGFGSTVLLSRRFSDHLGAEFAPTAIFRSDGFYRFGGLSADLGVVYGWRNERVELGVAAGPSVMLGSDSDGTFLALGGGYVGIRALYWPGGDWFGLFARGSVRLWHTGDLGPAGTAGVAVRF